MHSDSDFGLKTSLAAGIDSNIMLLDFPSHRGKLQLAILHTEKTGEDFLLDVTSFDDVTVTAKGHHFHGVDVFCGLQNVRVKSGSVSIGHEEYDDIAVWHVEPGAEVMVYRWALPDYPGVEDANFDQKATAIVRAPASHGRLVGYWRSTGAELACMNFEAE